MKTTGIPVDVLANILTDYIGIKQTDIYEKLKRHKDVYYVYWETNKEHCGFRYTENNSDDEAMYEYRICHGYKPCDIPSFIGVIK